MAKLGALILFVFISHTAASQHESGIEELDTCTFNLEILEEFNILEPALFDYLNSIAALDSTKSVILIEVFIIPSVCDSNVGKNDLKNPLEQQYIGLWFQMFSKLDPWLSYSMKNSNYLYSYKNELNIEVIISSDSSLQISNSSLRYYKCYFACLESYILIDSREFLIEPEFKYYYWRNGVMWRRLP